MWIALSAAFMREGGGINKIDGALLRFHLMVLGILGLLAFSLA